MKIGLVGYQASGKSSLFQWLTGEAPDPSQTHSGQSAMAAIPEPRIAQLCEIYQPKKITEASLEIVDTPGLSRTHEGNAQRLALIREAGCLVLVVPVFDRRDPSQDLAGFDEDLMLADMEIVSGRIQRIEDSMKRPIPKSERDKLQFELDTLNRVLGALESGTPLREEDLSDEEQKVTRAFRLLSEKPRMILVNTADDEDDPAQYQSLATAKVPVATVSVGLELELAQMTREEAEAFREEMGLQSADRDAILRMLLDVSGQMIFFTAGEKEVRTWLLRKGATAVEAAGRIHTDMAKGFIRAEVMTCSDLVRLGSEREVKAQNLARKEPKDYVVGHDDILLFHFSG